MKLNVDFSDLYKAAEAMGAQPVEMDISLSDEKISVDRIGHVQSDIATQPPTKEESKVSKQR